jgi:ABC-2 type transport system permease protein
MPRQGLSARVGRLLLGLFVVLAGLLVPSVGATYTVVAERERRTLELLLMLPVRVSDVLLAKLLAMVGLTAAILLPLYAFDAVFLLGSGLVGPRYLGLVLLVLLAAVGYAVAVALLLALLARDLRTANSLNGALLGPLVPLVVAVLATVPGDAGLLAVAGLLLLAGALALVVALRWLTFERYLL